MRLPRIPFFLKKDNSFFFFLKRGGGGGGGGGGRGGAGGEVSINDILLSTYISPMAHHIHRHLRYPDTK